MTQLLVNYVASFLLGPIYTIFVTSIKRTFLWEGRIMGSETVNDPWEPGGSPCLD